MTTAFATEFTAQRNRLNAMEDLSRTLPISKTTGNSFSIPIHIVSADQGSMKKIRRRTVGDEMEQQAQTRACPSVRAIRMANAILLERILGTGQFMLNLQPSEIEKVLFETR